MLMFSGGKRAEASLLRLWRRAKIPHGFLLLQTPATIEADRL